MRRTLGLVIVPAAPAVSTPTGAGRAFFTDPAHDGVEEAVTPSSGNEGGGRALVWWILRGGVLAVVAIGFWLWRSNGWPDEHDEPDSIVDEPGPPEGL